METRHLRFYAIYVLEIIIASTCMVIFVGVTALVNVAFNHIIEQKWVKLRLAEHIFTAIEYFLILVALLVFIEMCVFSTRLFRLQLRRFLLQLKQAVVEVDPDGQLKAAEKSRQVKEAQLKEAKVKKELLAVQLENAETQVRLRDARRALGGEQGMEG